ncbi:hypothetical protein FRX31_006487, partial [Thalictrum thalictroides]
MLLSNHSLFLFLSSTILSLRLGFNLCFSFPFSFSSSITELVKFLLQAFQGVGPSIAISFSVYETLRSSWHLRRLQDFTVL